MAKITTLAEIERYWSIDDLMDANEVLDVQLELAEQEIARLRRG